jgi:hypothetical protein
MRTPSQFRIDVKRYNQVLRTRICPGCSDHLVVDVIRRRSSSMDDDRSFGGSYHECGGPEGHHCWNMTKFNPRKPSAPLYERSGV